MAKKLKTFYISGVVKMQVGIQIEAGNYQEALDQAKLLKETDFVKPLGDYEDGEFVGIGFISAQEPEKI